MLGITSIGLFLGKIIPNIGADSNRIAPEDQDSLQAIVMDGESDALKRANQQICTHGMIRALVIINLNHGLAQAGYSLSKS